MTEGAIIIDKPKGLSSAKAVSRLKRILGVKKIGHAGTLDPFATGVLLCCINRATKLSQFLLKKDKKYEAILCLGIATDTQDLTGKIISEKKIPKLELSDIEKAAQKFTKEIEQTPPAYSALKHKGVPLYKLARAGKPVYKPARKVFVEYIKIIEINLPYIKFETKVSSGTYIRTLAADIGESLCCGAHLTELRRLACAGFDIENALTIEEVEEKVLSGEIEKFVIPMKNILPCMSEILVGEKLESKILNGCKLSRYDLDYKKYISENEKKEKKLKVINKNNKLIAILELNGKTYNYRYVFN